MAHQDRSGRILIDWDRMFDTLVSLLHRYVLEYLHDRSELASVWDLAVALAVRTTDLPSDEVDVQVVQQAGVGIVHVYLPRPQAVDLVEPGGDGVSLTEHAETFPLFTPAYRGVVRPVGDGEKRRKP